MRVLHGSLESFAGHVRLVELPKVNENRGRLIEFDYASLPFVPRRSFIIDNVPRGTVRGGHAHKVCQQLLVCLQGRLTVELVFKNQQAEALLDDPAVALYLAAGVFARQRYDELDTRLLVFASLPYDSESYVTDLSKL